MFEIKNLNDEYFSNLAPEVILEIKELPTEDKIKCFRYFLGTDVVTNVSVISNLFILINGITDIEDNALGDERIFFSSLEEYIDIKLEIKNEIDVFNTKLLEYYLGIIKGLSVNLDELKSHIPNTFFNIMPLVTTNLVSKLTVKYLDRIENKHVKPVFNAMELYSEINNQDTLFLGFVQSLVSEVSRNDTDFNAALR